METTGNTVLITGGGTGIGLALAQRLLKDGNTVIITGRRQNVLDDAVAQHAGLKSVVFDVASSPQAHTEFAAKLVKDYPELNVLVNNAGISKPESGGIDLTVSEEIININILGVVRLTSALLPQLRAVHSPKRTSTIITVTSGLAHVPAPGFPTYCASKAFIHSWSQSLRYQLSAETVGDGKVPINVIEITPPYVQTEITGPQQKTDPRAMPLDDYADQTYGLLQQIPLVQSDGTAPGEVLVDNVKQLRFAQRDGKYQDIFNYIVSLFLKKK
eukprot:TRINITY_DN345_c1_g1_i2.p1 TRINITY_DN345_c1_g1~~TRINITY_DN345_c1_g1_i2.p1  ORF type:complete len:272 (-),score=51.22 TRINITY_DN345_c1_g1_i2:49-864(-)